jgi:hypothetical protein
MQTHAAVLIKRGKKAIIDDFAGVTTSRTDSKKSAHEEFNQRKEIALADL